MASTSKVKRVPKTLKILGHKFKVDQLPSSSFDPPSKTTVNALSKIGHHFVYYGECYPDAMLININKELGDSVKAETLIHEILHILIEYCGAGDKIKDGKEEPLVQSLANGLTNVLLSNKNLLRYLGSS